MNKIANSRRGYSMNAAATQTDRRAEYNLISRLTYRMRATALRVKENYPEYAEALHDNRRLWNTLAIDVADKENALPEQLKAQVFYLAEFTAQHTSKILKNKASVMPLLEINMADLRGLKTEGAIK